MLDLGQRNLNLGDYAGFRGNMTAPAHDVRSPRHVDLNTEEGDQQYDRVRSCRREHTRQANNTMEQRNLQNAWIIKSIKKWNIKFSGKAGEDPEYFLVRMRESMQVTSLSSEDFFVCLPFFFQSIALEWHRNSGHRWKN